MEIKTDTINAVVNATQTRFTVYQLHITSSARIGPTDDWLLEKRFSEFFFFRRDMLALLHKWASALGSNPTNDPSTLEAFTVANNALQPALSAKFPRKHMRCDTPEIVAQRRNGLTDFVRLLLAAYADISVFVANNNGHNGSSAVAPLTTLFEALEAFLCVPDAQKDEERRQADAILALDDVDSDAAHTCCICLDDTSATSATSATCQTSDVRSDPIKIVQLPCRHQFHEDCILDWFNASTTCPLCRRVAFKDCPRVFDVTMRELTEL